MLSSQYSPYDVCHRCGACRQLEPHLIEVSEGFYKHRPRVHIGVVNTTHSPELAARFNVTQFPAFADFRFGKQYAYKGTYSSAMGMLGI